MNYRYHFGRGSSMCSHQVLFTERERERERYREREREGGKERKRE